MKHIALLLYTFCYNLGYQCMPYTPPEHFVDTDVDYQAFVCRVIADQVTYPGLVVNGGAVVTDHKVKTAKNVAVCYRDYSCQEDGEIYGSYNEFGIIYVKAFIGPYYRDDFMPFTYQQRMTRETSCVSVAYNHAPLKAVIGGNFDMSNCSLCAYMDGVFCDKLYVGAVAQTANGKFLLPYKQMVEYVERNIANDSVISKDYPNINRMGGSETSHCRIKYYVSSSVVLVVGCISVFRISILY